MIDLQTADRLRITFRRDSYEKNDLTFLMQFKDENRAKVQEILNGFLTSVDNSKGWIEGTDSVLDAYTSEMCDLIIRFVQDRHELAEILYQLIYKNSDTFEDFGIYH